MTIPAITRAEASGRRVQVLLNGPRITSDFRNALLAAADAADMTPAEFVLTAAAEKLIASGITIVGIFRPGDIDHHNDNATEQRRHSA